MKLRYTLPALDDLASILDYIKARSPKGSERVHARIKTSIDLLALHPMIGAPTQDPIIRRMVAVPYPYLVFYEVRDNEIIIHAVRHATRNPSGMPGAG